MEIHFLQMQIRDSRTNSQPAVSAEAHIPAVPSRNLQVFLFLLVLAIQQAPIATGRPLLMARFMRADASSRFEQPGTANAAVAKSDTKRLEKCILKVVLK